MKILTKKFLQKKINKDTIQAKINEYRYVRYFKNHKIQKNSIFYDAYNTKIMSGNPYALFKELIGDIKYDHFTHYWVFADDDFFQSEPYLKFNNKSNVFFVKKNSRAHINTLATCEYLICNSALPRYWSKRNGQIYINTWHGTPLKLLGKDAKDSNAASILNAQRNFLMSDYLVMPNLYTIEKIFNSYDLNGILSAKLIDVGYPRSDSVMNTDPQKIRDFLEKRSGIKLQGKKIILYAPTFRSQNGKSLNKSKEICEHVSQLNKYISEDYVVFLKIHNLLAKFFKNNHTIKSRLLFDELDTNELLSSVDILITDYSSIFFDFLCLRRSIIFFVYDRDDYEGNRGTYFPLTDLPGNLCMNIEEVVQSVKDIEQGIYQQRYQAKHERFINKFAYNENGYASKTTKEIIFEGKQNDNCYLANNRKKNVLLYLGNKLIDYEIRDLCYKMLSIISSESYNIIIWGSDVWALRNEFYKINRGILLFASELKLNKTVVETISLYIGQKKKKDKYFYQRQYKKIFGNICFDTIFDFVGKDNYDLRALWSMNFPHYCYVVSENSDGLIQNISRNLFSEYEKIYITDSDKDKNKKENKYCINKKTLSVQRIDCNKNLASPKILFIASYDSTNYVFVNLIKEFEHRGWEYTVIVPNGNDFINNKMFINNSIKITSISEFDYNMLSLIDFVISTPFTNKCYNHLYRLIKQKNKFIVSFATLFSSILMRISADLVFCSGKYKFEEYRQNQLIYNMIAVGNPQYDDLIKYRKSHPLKDINKIKRVLFIDQGGYPFGREGKTILAKTLENLAHNNPDIEFVIKPRYIPDESGAQLHKLSEHLYDFIKNEPDNLVLIKEPTIIEDIIVDFDAIITMWSTTFLDAVVLGLPLLLISGIPSLDTFDVRSQRVSDAYKCLKASGCIVDYRDLWDKPISFRYANSDFVKAHLSNIDEPCAPKIADALEMIYIKLIKHNMRFAEYFQMDFDEFIDNMNDPSQKKFVLQNIKEPKWHKRLYYVDFINKHMQQFVYENRCMAMEMDLSELYPFWFYTKDEGKITTIKRQALFIVKRELIKMKFWRSYQSNPNNDPIKQDYYFEWLFRYRKFRKLIHCNQSIHAKQALLYFQGMAWYRKGRYKKAAKLFAQFEQNQKKPIIRQTRRDRMFYTSFVYTLHLFTKELLLIRLEQEGAYDILKQLIALPRFDRIVRKYILLKLFINESKWNEAIEVYESYFVKLHPRYIHKIMIKKKARSLYLYAKQQTRQS